MMTSFIKIIERVISEKKVVEVAEIKYETFKIICNTPEYYGMSFDFKIVKKYINDRSGELKSNE